MIGCCSSKEHVVQVLLLLSMCKYVFLWIFSMQGHMVWDFFQIVIPRGACANTTIHHIPSTIFLINYYMHHTDEILKLYRSSTHTALLIHRYAPVTGQGKHIMFHLGLTYSVSVAVYCYLDISLIYLEYIPMIPRPPYLSSVRKQSNFLSLFYQIRDPLTTLRIYKYNYYYY